MTGLQRLQALYDWAIDDANLPPDRFDMSVWWRKKRGCGTVGCLIGWAAYDCDALQAEGLSLDAGDCASQPFVPWVADLSDLSNSQPMHSLAVFFNIPAAWIYFVFDSSSYVELPLDIDEDGNGVFKPFEDLTETDWEMLKDRFGDAGLDEEVREVQADKAAALARLKIVIDSVRRVSEGQAPAYILQQFATVFPRGVHT